MKALFMDGADAETIDKCVACSTDLMDKLNTRFSDGRKHASGETVTSSDFNILYFYTGIVNNTS